MKRILICFAALLAAGCDCGKGPSKNAAAIEVLNDNGSDRTKVDFGFVQVNLKGTQKVRVRNKGNGELSISAATFSKPVFSAETSLPFTIAAGDQGELSLSFTPTVPDEHITGTVQLTTNDPEHETVTLDLEGQGVTAVARPTPTTLAFGDVYIGENKSLMLTLTNAGGNALPVKGAAITGSTDVTADFTALTNVMIPAGGSASVQVKFAPMVGSPFGTLSGAVEIDIDQSFGGKVTVPITGRATQALPKMCFKFDDSATETCTDQVTSSLNVNFGGFCDNTLYSCPGTSGQRTGKLYFKNEGNIPVTYTVRYSPYTYGGKRCAAPDAGVLSDFVFSNVPVPADGAPMPLTTATTGLPMAETDPKPWETAPITVTYRAASQCLDEGADQAQVLWTRQGPTGRTPATLFATLTGTSLLPNAKPKPVNIGQPQQPADVPFTTPLGVELVTNQGQAPLTISAVELWEELPAYLADGGTYDGGGPEGGILSRCNPASPTYSDSDCARFQWAPGQDPASLLPLTLDGGASAARPTQATLGKLYVGCLGDGGSCPPATTRYKVVAVVVTSDPYAARVGVPIIAYVRFLP
ncbi:MAG: choice-of-anchor D domain-containing protein [Archangiaceae bacterium]|nr:choice-of-anchor D domain-containing protein [Archangiaceae bacterium]